MLRLKSLPHKAQRDGVFHLNRLASTNKKGLIRSAFFSGPIPPHSPLRTCKFHERALYCVSLQPSLRRTALNIVRTDTV
jgi:hypothetical protein